MLACGGRSTELWGSQVLHGSQDSQPRSCTLPSALCAAHARETASKSWGPCPEAEPGSTCHPPWPCGVPALPVSWLRGPGPMTSPLCLVPSPAQRDSSRTHRRRLLWGLKWVKTTLCVEQAQGVLRGSGFCRSGLAPGCGFGSWQEGQCGPSPGGSGGAGQRAGPSPPQCPWQGRGHLPCTERQEPLFLKLCRHHVGIQRDF